MSRHVNDRLPLDIPPTSSIGIPHSPPRSPHSTASLPSPPSSPNHRDRDLNSIPGSPSSLASDFPLSSLNSSFFLSEQSSPVLNPILPEDVSKTLIMPSLTLPVSRHDPPPGESIGNVRLWVMGRHSHGCRSAAERLLEGPSSVMDVDPWTNTIDNYPILRASTGSSSEVRVRRNVEVTLVEYDENDVSIVRISFSARSWKLWSTLKATHCFKHLARRNPSTFFCSGSPPEHFRALKYIVHTTLDIQFHPDIYSPHIPLFKYYSSVFSLMKLLS